MNELVRWDPFKAIAPFESLFDVPSLLRPMRSVISAGPRMDVADYDDAYELAVELPGVKKEAIQVSVHENRVTVSAELPAPQDEGNGQWLLRERDYGKFSRTLSLPEAVDEEASQARYSDGVLTLTLRKKAASRQKRLTIH
ncbi:MAG TPA: Hsp20/alpha crystallin family protein [Burkholderiales bacterium]